MLTSRGWWFLFLLILQVVIGILFSDRGLGVIAVLGMTFLAWFVYELAFFSIQCRFALPRLRITRQVRDGRRDVPLLWMGREFEIVVRIELDSVVPLPFVIFNDRFPSGADHLAGENEHTVMMTRETPLEIRYRIRTTHPGELRFEGVRVQIADRQGFFYSRIFLRELIIYPVLPPLTDAEGNRRVSKSHNIIPPPGIHRLRAAGGGGDLLDLRDYRAGDPPKMIAWKASARRDKLITKEFESDVPLKCTLFVDQSQSVRLGQPRATMLSQLTMVASGVAQAATTDRDLVGLTLFDETSTSVLQPARTSRHLIQLMHRLSDAARARPISPKGDADDLARVCTPVANDIYPDLMDRATNRTTWMFFWNPLLDGRWAWFVLFLMMMPLLILFREVREGVAWTSWRISGQTENFWFWLTFVLVTLSPFILGGLWWVFHGVQTMFAPYYAQRDRRKRLAALFTAVDGSPVGNITLLVEDDDLFSRRAQLFLAHHHIRYPVELYDEKGRYLFRSEAKIDTLARALQYSTTRGHDNELFVIMADLIELDDSLEPLLKSVRVAIGRHHQVMVVCPWLSEIPKPEQEFGEEPDRKELRKRMTRSVHHLPHLEGELMRDTMVRYHQAYYRVRKAFARLGVVLIRADEGEPVRMILSRLEQLRTLRRRR